MSLIYAGGWIMLPLLLVSIVVVAIIIDRCLVLIWSPMPTAEKQREITEALEKNQVEKAAEILRDNSWLDNFANSICRTDLPTVLYEDQISQSIIEIRDYLERRLALLSTLAKISPLLGLLGTVIGMIQTFSVVAKSTAGINMEVLADGIWQALITTATGLIIAIPALLIYKWIQGVEEGRLAIFSRIGTTACAVRSLEPDSSKK